MKPWNSDVVKQLLDAGADFTHLSPKEGYGFDLYGAEITVLQWAGSEFDRERQKLLRQKDGNVKALVEGWKETLKPLVKAMEEKGESLPRISGKVYTVRECLVESMLHGMGFIVSNVDDIQEAYLLNQRDWGL